MLSANIDAITAADIERLVADQVPEGKRLDYKEDPHLDQKEGKRRFCEHVSSFANALGGWLVLGVREATGEDGRRLGTPGENHGRVQLAHRRRAASPG